MVICHKKTLREILKYSCKNNLSESSCTAVDTGCETDKSDSKPQMFPGNLYFSGALPVSQFTHNREIHIYHNQPH